MNAFQLNSAKAMFRNVVIYVKTEVFQFEHILQVGEQL